MAMLCNQCYFYGKCFSDNGCEDFTPLDCDNESDTINLIEARRQEFISEWDKYLREYGD